MKKVATMTRNHWISTFFEKTAQLWALYLFFVILYQYFFNQLDGKIVVTLNTFYLTGAISSLSACFIILRDKGRTNHEHTGI